MGKNFSTCFSKSLNRIPIVKGFKLVMFHFSIIHHKKHHGVPVNVLFAKYRKKHSREVELLIQTPQKEVLKNVNFSSFRTIRIGNRKVHTGYNPGFSFFPSHYFSYHSPYGMYTIISGNEVITIATSKKEDINFLKVNHFVKLEPTITKLMFMIPDEINDFVKYFVSLDKRMYRSYVSVLFLNVVKKTEVSIKIFEDDEATLNEIINDVIACKRRIDNLLTKGKIGRKNLIFSRRGKNIMLIFRCTKGDENILTEFAKKAVQKFV